MRHVWAATRVGMVFALLFVSPARAADSGPRLAEPWETAYAGDDAAGKHVIGLWKFDGTGEKDDSGHGHALKIDGARISPDGRFGQCLESFPGFPQSDKRHAARTNVDPRLSPQGAFTLEMWIKPKPEFADSGDSMLLDKKYVAHDDYQFVLSGTDRSGSRVLRAWLGFGVDSATWYSRPLTIQAGQWYHVAFTYDGAGTGSFYVNGQPQGSTTLPGRKELSRGKHPLSIGDRLGSNYRGFPGFIDEVRISNGVLEFRQAKFARVSDRSCFLRMEPQAVAQLTVTNLQRQPLKAAEVRIATEGLAERIVAVKDLPPGQSTSIDYPIDTALRPGKYEVCGHLKVIEPAPGLLEERFPIQIVARPPVRMPVLMWGIYGGISEQMPLLKQMGFTHALGLGADYAAIFAAGQPIAVDKPERLQDNYRMLDDALANHLDVVASLSPGSYLRGKEEFRRIDRKGKPQSGAHPDICGLKPGVAEFCYNVGASVGQTYGKFPAFQGALLHTEVRDAAQPCFHPWDIEAYRKASGQDVPAEVAGKSGLDYTKLAGFPASRVIADNDPRLAYFRWYWKQGDGWNQLNTAVNRGLKETIGRQEFWTFHDPAVRVASTYGSGGAVDFISQWTYSYPDPLRIGLATDELLAMAGGGPAGQQVMKMTQIIWYRSQTAPLPKPGAQPLSYQARWEIEQPDAPFITIAPLHLREALWTKIARPIKGIMYHGWQSLVKTEGTGGYRFTNPQTKEELARLTSEVIRPLGPTLLAVPGVKSDVAYLQSFAAEMFARRGTYGWGGKWGGDAYHVCLWAHLQPDIVFDETIIDKGLDGYRVLVMCDADVITEKMLARIQAFQKQGGIIVGDDHLAPALKADIVLPPYARQGRADADKQALQALAAELRKQLDGRYTRYVDSTTPDVIPYRRAAGSADYVFLVNDRRDYGQYVGQHALVMENGQPASARVSIGRKTGHVYDLCSGQTLESQVEQGRLTLPVQLGPGDGRMLLVAAQPIVGVQLNGPRSVARGSAGTFDVAVVDAGGKPIDAVVPVEVTIRDAEGRLAEHSGYYAANGGTLRLKLDIAVNDVPGAWQVQIRELASRRTAELYFRVPGPEPWPPAGKPIPQELANPVQPKG